MTTASDITLYGYWRSGPSYRTRIALNFKGIAYDQRPVNLLQKAHQDPEYLALNPQGLVPTLVAGDVILTQSSAILEWIEECYPDPSLLPKAPTERAIVRSMAMTIACDIHPVNNLRVLERLTREYGADDIAKREWISRWTSDGFATLETMVGRHGGVHAFGNQFTLADCYIVTQLYSAERFGVRLDFFPLLQRVAETARRHPAVEAAHPDRQPDAQLG